MFPVSAGWQGGPWLQPWESRIGAGSRTRSRTYVGVREGIYAPASYTYVKVRERIHAPAHTASTSLQIEQPIVVGLSEPANVELLGVRAV